MPNGRKGGRRGEFQTSIVDRIAGEIDAKLKKMADLSAADLVKYAEETGDFLANTVRLKTSQIRKFLDAVNVIRSESVGEEDYLFEERVILLKPKLAYAAGRQDQVQPLMTVLEPCMNKVKDKDDFLKFFRFIEAIVAYHRYCGGRD